MRAILLSNGPTARAGILRVATMDAKARADTVVVGANWVAEQARLDWWCLSDWAPITGDPERGIKAVDVARWWDSTGAEMPARWYSRHVLEKLGRRDPQGLVEAIHLTTVVVPQCLPMDGLSEAAPNWWSWSGTLALSLIWWLRPQECEVYGMDLGGVVDCRGDTDAPNRSPDRWAQEASLANRIVGACRARGVGFKWGCSPQGINRGRDCDIQADWIGATADARGAAQPGV